MKAWDISRKLLNGYEVMKGIIMKNIKKTTNDGFNSFKGKAIEFLSVFIITITLFYFARRAAFWRS